MLNELLQHYSTETLERHFVYAFLSRSDLSYSKNSILRSYFENFENDPKLYIDASMLNLNTLQELENCLELLIPKKDRKLNGAFFTPPYIINYIINQIKPKADDKNLDPSCGCGAFLMGLIRYYQSNYKKKIRQIIRENIFGADILEYNIHRAKLLLSILALQNNETVEEDDFNLAVQDSLRANWKESFRRNGVGKFDNIISNPPYVKFQDLSDENRSYLSHYWKTIQNGTFNLYFAFFELGYKLLNANGRLGYITPNNYFTSLAGESLRGYFQNKHCLSRVVDFSHTKVFGAQTYTAITFLNKKKNFEIIYDRIEKDQKPEVFLRNANGSPNTVAKLDIKKWRLLKSDEQKNIRIIETIGTPLNRLVNISVGIATLKDELYFLDRRFERNGLLLKVVCDKTFEIEPEITRDIYKISDFKTQEQCNHNTRKIIFPYNIASGTALPIRDEQLERDFPKCYQYFLCVKDKLRQRDKGKTKIEPFYAFGRTQGLTKMGEKILTPTFSKRPRFMIVEDEQALFCNGYGIYFEKERTTNSLFKSQVHPLSKVENIDLLQKILNSYLMHYYVSKTSVSIAGGYPCYQKNFIQKFTIPNFTDSELETLSALKEPQQIDNFLIEKYQLNLLVPKRLS